MSCHCGSGLDFAACCEPIIAGRVPAPTPEALMRARYTAYTQCAIDFLLDSVRPDLRGEHDPNSVRNWAEKSDWKGLEILATTGGGPQDETGTVEFVARYVYDGEDHVRRHHERATFERVDGQWYFASGEPVKGVPIVREEPKIGRNDPCPCGSGKKYKKCCGQS